MQSIAIYLFDAYFCKYYMIIYLIIKILMNKIWQ